MDNKYKLSSNTSNTLCEERNKGGLGFRYISCFNQVMLAKQDWKLLTIPTCLMATVLKAKHVAKMKFCKSKKGHETLQAYYGEWNFY